MRVKKCHDATYRIPLIYRHRTGKLVWRYFADLARWQRCKAAWCKRLGVVSTVLLCLALLAGVQTALAQSPPLSRIQALYAQAHQAGLAPTYTAPLPWAPEGPQYLLGGLDVMEALRHYETMQRLYPGTAVFAQGKDVFGTSVELLTPQGVLLFRSEANRAAYLAGHIEILLGGQCLFGAIATPATATWPHPKASSWAHPAMGRIEVEQAEGVTYLGLNAHYAPSSQLVPNRWTLLETELRRLLGEQHPWEVKRAHYHLWKY